MHPELSSPGEDRRRWLALAVMVAAQFIYVVDAFIVNVAIPAIRADIGASAFEIEAVIAVYQIAYASVVISGGRLGDIYGQKRLFLAGLAGFVAASLWCGLSGSAASLIAARLCQGGAAALMVPQVLATIHILFPGAERRRAFGIFGMALGFGGAAGFVIGGFLVTLDLAGLGWRLIFFVNLPIGVAIAAAALVLLPAPSGRRGLRLDLPGAGLVFAALILLISPVMAGRDLGWAPWLFAAMAAGGALVAGFLGFERRLARRGGSPLIDVTLFADAAFIKGLGATFCFFLGNFSFYLVVTLFLQSGLGFSALDAGLTLLPLALAFALASRLQASHGHGAGPGALILGCCVQVAGTAGLALVVLLVSRPGMALLIAPLVVFGCGQGLVMAPLFATVLGEVRGEHAGSGSGLLATVQQGANAAGVAVAGAIYFGIAAAHAPGLALAAALAFQAACVVGTIICLARLRPAARIIEQEA
jgi:EmrB/QacA subfamily drug resistance transporter